MLVVHVAMFRQICREYGSLPNPRALTIPEIVFFYDGICPELIQRTKSRKKK